MSFKTSQQFFVAINPVLVRYFQSLTVAAIFERAEYWFSKKDKQFYKFIEPCNHPCYREGDSWCEELGITRKVFRKAFAMIGIRYISKTQFDQEEDPFKGKFFAYYFDRKSNKTIFIRNNKAVEDFFQETKLKISSTSARKKETAKKLTSEITQSEFTSQNSQNQPKGLDFKKGRSCTGPLGQSYVHANKDISNITSNSSREEKITQEDFKNSELSQQMIQVWKEETEDKLQIPEKTTQALPHVLSSLFEGSMENWKTYCRQIASSKFLMGEGSNKDFRTRLSWVIQERTIERVKANEFGSDRIPPKIQEQKNQIGMLLREKDDLLRKSDSLGSDLERQFRNKTKEILESSSVEEKAHLEEEFRENLNKEDTEYAQEFKRRGWKTMFSEVRFLCFVKEKIFGKVDESPVYLNSMADITTRLEDIETQLRSI